MVHTTRPALSFRLIKAVGRTLDGLRLVRVKLEVDPLLGIATRRTGFTDFGDLDFLEGLRTLLSSLEEDAGLHPIGRLSLQEIVVDSLVNRLLLTEAETRPGSLYATPDPAPHRLGLAAFGDYLLTPPAGRRPGAPRTRILGGDLSLAFTWTARQPV